MKLGEILIKANMISRPKLKGCFHCLDSGYSGRTGIYEVLSINDEIKEMILKGKTSNEIELVAKRSGSFTTLKENAALKVLQGETTLEEAASIVMY